MEIVKLPVTYDPERDQAIQEELEVELSDAGVWIGFPGMPMREDPDSDPCYRVKIEHTNGEWQVVAWSDPEARDPQIIPIKKWRRD